MHPLAGRKSQLPASFSSTAPAGCADLRPACALALVRMRADGGVHPQRAQRTGQAAPPRCSSATLHIPGRSQQLPHAHPSTPRSSCTFRRHSSCVTRSRSARAARARDMRCADTPHPALAPHLPACCHCRMRSRSTWGWSIAQTGNCTYSCRSGARYRCQTSCSMQQKLLTSWRTSGVPPAAGFGSVGWCIAHRQQLVAAMTAGGAAPADCLLHTAAPFSRLLFFPRWCLSGADGCLKPRHPHSGR